MRGQEEPFIVLQRDQVVLGDGRVRCVDDGQLDVAVLEGLDGERAAAVLDGRESHLEAVLLGQAQRAVGAGLRLRIGTKCQRCGHVREISDGGKIPFLGEGAGDHIGVLIRGIGLCQNAEPVGDNLLQFGEDILGQAGLGVRRPVLQERPRVFGEQVDGAGLDLRQVGLPLADPELAVHLEAARLERLRVDLRDDLIGVVVLRAHHDGGGGLRGGAALLRRVCGQRISAAAPGQGQSGGKGNDEGKGEDYALEVEKVTTSKKDNLILNVDGCIGICFVDMLRNEMPKEESDEYIKMGALNGLFVVGRTIGMTAHFLDQKRLKQGLYRHPWDDITYMLE